jgi:hypothetical protein
MQNKLAKYFLAKVQFLTEDEKSGKIKKVTNQYLVDAMSCTEAEAKVTKWLGDLNDFEVKSVSESAILGVIEN